MYSLASLNGTYGFYRFGTNHSSTPAIDVASVGHITFDGKGGASGTQQTSNSGSFDPTVPGFPAPTPYSYTVSSNGTYAVMAAGNVLSNGVIVDGGNELYSMSMVGDRAVIVVAKRMPESIDPRLTHPEFDPSNLPKP
jgi:hypothetical protein